MPMLQKKPASNASAANTSAECHMKAASCCDKAAEEHRHAAKSCTLGDPKKAATHAKQAQDHCLKAQEHGKQATAA